MKNEMMRNPPFLKAFVVCMAMFSAFFVWDLLRLVFVYIGIIRIINCWF